MLAKKGYSCLSMNHRGHDLATAPDPINPKVIGGLYDHFEDCTHDISAMVEFLVDKGAAPIVLAGHSQAAVKILYYIQNSEANSIAGVIMVSPPPSAPDMMRFLLGSKQYEEGLVKAQEYLTAGEPDRLLFFIGRGNLHYCFSAGTYLNVYGKESAAVTTYYLQNISCPMLAIRGQYDLPPVSAQLMETIKTGYGDPGQCQIIEIEGANHFFVGSEEPLSSQIVEWLSNLCSGA
jgi:pimeloyl-ACP methyl ester carboxylesterase